MYVAHKAFYLASIVQLRYVNFFYTNIWIWTKTCGPILWAIDAWAAPEQKIAILFVVV